MDPKPVLSPAGIRIGDVVEHPTGEKTIRIKSAKNSKYDEVNLLQICHGVYGHGEYAILKRDIATGRMEIIQQDMASGQNIPNLSQTRAGM